LCYCNKILEVINSKSGKVYFGLGFGGFDPPLVGSITFGPVLRQNIMAEACKGEAAQPMAAEREKETGEGAQCPL
jgi:hypothetical protein